MKPQRPIQLNDKAIQVLVPVHLWSFSQCTLFMLNSNPRPQCYLRNQFPQLGNIALITASPKHLYSLFILAHYVIIAEKNPVVNVLVGFPWEGQLLIAFDVFLCSVCFSLCMCVCVCENTHIFFSFLWCTSLTYLIVTHFHSTCLS